MLHTAVRSDILSLPRLASKQNCGSQLNSLSWVGSGGSYLLVGCCQPNNLVPPPEPNANKQ